MMAARQMTCDKPFIFWVLQAVFDVCVKNGVESSRIPNEETLLDGADGMLAEGQLGACIDE